MEFEVSPPLPESALRALQRAMAMAGVRLESTPAGYESAWRKAAAREAVEGLPARVGYALSPRSTRGATRA